MYGADGQKKGTLPVGVFIIFIVAFPFHVYIAMAWQVASVVCVVEDTQGLNTMKTSKQPTKGKRDSSLALNLFYALLMGVIGGVQRYSAYGKEQQVMSVGVIVVVVLLQCIVYLASLLTRGVLNFVCKSCHPEDTHLKALFSHLRMYNRGYMLPKDASMEFEMFRL
ncbi:hypothetical protein SUGI_1196870 [Cryptomeria japonica]|nr:hypothetical protein SUGI_1196870 [Cryptomeria japonica]